MSTATCTFWMAREALTRRRFSGQRTLPCLFRERETEVSNILLAWRWQIEDVLCGGENYDGARPCHYEWVKSLSDQCRAYHVSFNFIETGTCFVKDGRTYRIHDKQVQSKQAYLSGLSFQGKPISYKLHLPEGNLFGNEIIKPQALFRAHCKTCGSRMTCNGCSNCGACDNR